MINDGMQMANFQMQIQENIRKEKERDQQNLIEGLTHKARWTFRRLQQYITFFEKTLDEDHEVGAYLANYPNGAIHFNKIGYWEPDIITFDGFSSEGDQIKLIQNVAQLNIVLVALKKLNEKPTRIGFDVPQTKEETT